MEDESRKVFDVIARAAKDDREAAGILESLSFRVEYLKILDGLLKPCSADRKMTYWCLLTLRDLVTKRGCVLTLDEILEHQSLLLEAGNGLCTLIAGDVAINNIFSQALAITYRMRVEKQNVRGIEPFKELFHFFSLSQAHQMLAFNAMYFIVDIMKTKLRHVTVHIQKNLIDRFADRAIFDYIEGCLRVIGTEGHPMTQVAFGLFCDLYMFGSQNTFLSFQFKWSVDYERFYGTTQIAQTIDLFMKFIASDNQPMSTKAMRALLCYASVDPYTWPSRIMPYLELWMQICRAVLPLISTHSNVEALSLFVAKFAHAVNLEEFSKTEMAPDFFASALELSKRALNKEPSNLLELWQKTAALSSSCPEPLRKMPSEVFRQLLDTVLADAEDCFQYVAEDIDYFDTVFGKLWKVVLPEKEDACQYFLQAIIDRVDSIPTFVIAILISGTLITEMMDVGPVKGAIIRHLIDRLASLERSNNETMVTVENVVIKFASQIRKHLLQERSNLSMRCLQGIGMTKGRERQELYDFWINRFMDDLYVFNSDAAMLERILVFVKEMMTSMSLESLSKSNERLKKFVTREESFVFSEIAFEHQRKLWITLYWVYTKNIKREWPVFFQQFDEAFQSLCDVESAYILFCQIKGMLTAVKPVKDDNMRVFRWFLHNHVGDTIRSIRSCSDNRAVSAIIASVWARLCAKERQDFSEDTAEGILLFKGTRDIVAALLECTYEDKEWFVIKILRPVFRGRYANFGIMKMYGDDSFDVTCEIFFDILRNWVIGENAKWMSHAIDAVAALNEILPEVVFGDEARIGSVCECLIDAMLRRIPRLWVDACVCLGKLMASAIIGHVPLKKFFQHFIVVIDGLIHMPLDGTDDKEMRNSTKQILFFMVKYELPAVEKFFEEVVNAYEPKYRDLVRPVFAKLIKSVNVERSEPDKALVSHIEAFQVEMQSYLIYVSNIPVFAPIFTRTRPE